MTCYVHLVKTFLNRGTLQRPYFHGRRRKMMLQKDYRKEKEREELVLLSSISNAGNAVANRPIFVNYRK